MCGSVCTVCVQNILKSYEQIFMIYFAEVDRTRGTNRLDFGGDPVTPSLSLPQSPPQYIFSVIAMCFVLFARWLLYNAEGIKQSSVEVCTLY